MEIFFQSGLLYSLFVISGQNLVLLPYNKLYRQVDNHTHVALRPTSADHLKRESIDVDYSCLGLTT